MTKTVFQILHPLSCRYEEIYGQRPFDLSTWDPSQEFTDKMKPILQITPFLDWVNYYYTSMLPLEKKALLNTLGFDPQQKDCIISSNGTSSLSLFSNWLNREHFKELQVITPNYFSIVENCKSYSIDVKFIQIEDLNDIDNYHDKVFLFTNPYYSFGKSISQKNIDIIGKLLEKNWVIVDECLANKGDELSFIYGNHPHFMGIYTPHKSICLNGLKFSLIVFPIEFELFFAQSVDYLNGAISLSSLSGIKHYLSDNFDVYRNKFQECIYATHLYVKELLSRYPTVIYEGDGHHYFATIFFPNINASISKNENWLWAMIEKSGVIFTPGYYNNYPENSGFCFRINLTQDSSLFRKSLRNLLDTLLQYEQRLDEENMSFKSVTLKDRAIITNFTQASDSKISDFSFSAIMGWSAMYHTELFISNESLFIRFDMSEANQKGYMLPIGEIDIKQAIEMIEQDARSHGYEFCICGIMQNNKEDIEHVFPSKFSCSFERDECDYIYLRNLLENLTGKKLQSKRNHINNFKKNYDYQYIQVTEHEVSECIELEDKWYRNKLSTENQAELNNEHQFIFYTLNHLEELGAICGAIKINGKIIAFSIGSPINNDTFGINIEKADTQFAGVYAVINQEFVKHLPPQFLYINREEDMGIPGLRKAKLSYQPIEILKKYKAVLNS